MLENSKTGQVTGFLIKNWMPASVDRFLSESTGGIAGIEYAIKNVMAHNSRLLRAVFNAGPAINEMPRFCRDFADQDVKKVYLPQWFAADFLIDAKPGYEPITLTVVQTAAKKDDEMFGAKLAVYANKVKKEHTEDILDNKNFWESIRYAFAKIGVEEFWNRMTGTIKPSWGVLDHGRTGLLYLTKTDFHYCFLAKDARLPEGIDQIDLTRIESFIEECGMPINEFLRQNITKEYILHAVSRLGDTGPQTDLLGDLSGVVEDKERFAEENL